MGDGTGPDELFFEDVDRNTDLECYFTRLKFQLLYHILEKKKVAKENYSLTQNSILYSVSAR